jgi:hypothetical protein
MELSPSVASELARGVYGVQARITLVGFLARPEFSDNTAQKLHLKAEVGGRIIRNATDGFGLCAMGGIGHEK